MKCLLLVPLVLASSALAQSLDELTRPRDATSARVASNSPHDWSNADNRWIKPGETYTLAELEGPGKITHIWFTFPEAAASWISGGGSAAPDEIVLRMYWDGSEQPAVETPLGDFFACGFGQRAPVRSVPVQVQGGDSYNCFWPMPFFRSARITVTNESERVLAALYYQIDYTKEASLPKDSAYFCAQYRQEFPTVMGHDYLVADIEAPEGGGQYVGTVMSVRSRSPQWFGEGDDKFYVDGDTSPTLWGTGTEDYFENAWGMQEDTFPYFGVSRCDGWLAELGDTGTMYRWHIADPIRFRKTLRFEIEHKGWISADETTTGKINGHVEREDDFATVAFWYQRGQPKRFATLPPAGDRKLPEIDLVIQGRELLAVAETEGGAVSLQGGAAWTGDGQLFFDGQGVGSSVEFAFTIPEGQPRNLVLPLTHSYDFGIYQIYLDGEKYGNPVDCYGKDIKVVQQRFGELATPAGEHKIRLECVGINPNSQGYKVGIDCVRLRQRHTLKREPLDVPH
ncbi:MAG: DUF2961 domain-containing protein [Phycisphaerales bacterium]|nr:DUF2961 domain-containing protein [Phycisphaerales bacterium]